MRFTLALAGLGLMVALGAAPAAPAARARGLSLEQIRDVMRRHAAGFQRCLSAATRTRRDLHGPFLFQLEVDAHGQVTSARPFQASPVAAFDRCVVAILRRARFPGGPATFETPLVFDPR